MGICARNAETLESPHWIPSTSPAGRNGRFLPDHLTKQPGPAAPETRSQRSPAPRVGDVQGPGTGKSL